MYKCIVIVIVVIIIMNVYCSTAGSTVKGRTNATSDGQSTLSTKGSTHQVRSNIIISSSSAKATSSSKGSSSINSSLPQAKQHQHQLQSSSSSPSSQLWGGVWVPRSVTNSLRSNYWLPNDVFASSHISLGVQLTTDDSLLNTQWDG